MIEYVSNAEISTKLSECAVQGIHKAIGVTAINLKNLNNLKN